MQNSSLALSQNTPSGFISFGKINGVFGFRGEAKFFLHNRNTELLGRWISLYELRDGVVGRQFSVKLRASGKKIIGSIKELSTPEELEKVIGLELLLREEDLPELEEDEFYHHDLLGLDALTEEGENIGRVVEVNPGTVSVLTISNGEEEHYIPFLSERVLEVRPKTAIIVVL